MTFPQVSKYLAIILLISGFIGSFFIAEEVSTSMQMVPKYSYIYSDDMELKEVKDEELYNLVMVSSWIGSLVLCLALYGIGAVVEELRRGNTYKYEINGQINILLSRGSDTK